MQRILCVCVLHKIYFQHHSCYGRMAYWHSKTISTAPVPFHRALIFSVAFICGSSSRLSSLWLCGCYCCAHGVPAINLYLNANFTIHAARTTWYFVTNLLAAKNVLSSDRSRCLLLISMEMGCYLMAHDNHTFHDVYFPIYFSSAHQPPHRRSMWGRFKRMANIFLTQ